MLRIYFFSQLVSNILRIRSINIFVQDLLQNHFAMLTIDPSLMLSRLITVTWNSTLVGWPEYSTVQYSTVQNITVQCSTVQWAGLNTGQFVMCVNVVSAPIHAEISRLDNE